MGAVQSPATKGAQTIGWWDRSPRLSMCGQCMYHRASGRFGLATHQNQVQTERSMEILILQMEGSFGFPPYFNDGTTKRRGCLGQRDRARGTHLAEKTAMSSEGGTRGGGPAEGPAEDETSLCYSGNQT